MNNFCSVKDIKRMITQAKDTSDKRLLSKIYKELLKFNSKKTTQFKKWTTDLNRYLTKGDIQMAKIWKEVPYHMSPGKCKLIQDSTTHILEWPRSGTLTTPKAGEDMEQLKPSTADGNAEWYIHFGRQFGSFSTTKSTLNIWSSSRTPWYCWPEINRLPDTSPAKLDLFRISRELQFRVCNHGKSRASSCKARKGEHVYREEKEVGMALVNKESVAFHWLSPSQERRVCIPPFGLCYHQRTWSSPFWSPNSV